MRFELNSIHKKLIILQRNELMSNSHRRIRKLFGRFLYTNFFVNFSNLSFIKSKYYELCHKEYLSIKKFINFGTKNILSIGGGVGGVECLILNNNNCNIDMVERNFISKKIIYGFNKEAYSKLKLTRSFFKKNCIKYENLKVYDFDKDDKPIKKFNLVISLFSLDYHYDFHIYYDYLKKVSDENTVFIFDTIRSSYFSEIFENVEILEKNTNTIHTSHRLVCSIFK